MKFCLCKLVIPTQAGIHWYLEYIFYKIIHTAKTYVQECAEVPENIFLRLS